jgi:hypothetical protein
VLLTVVALLFETRTMTSIPAFIFALAWLVLSVGAVRLLYTLIQRGEPSFT